MRTSELLLQLADNLDSGDNSVLVRASEDERMVDIVANALVSAAAILRTAAEEVGDFGPDISEEDLEEMAVIAEEFDKSNDPLLQKQASVLDEILLSVSSDRLAIERFKQAQTAETERLRSKYRSQHLESDYHGAKKVHDHEIAQAGEGKPAEAISKRVKNYRPLEASLSTRYCPDHPGAPVLRIADSIYQCDLDKQLYNYEAGYTTMAGNSVPGTGVSNQSQFLGQRAPEHANFSTREQVLNSSE
jgi:hypothetical protein